MHKNGLLILERFRRKHSPGYSAGKQNFQQISGRNGNEFSSGKYCLNGIDNFTHFTGIRNVRGSPLYMS